MRNLTVTTALLVTLLAAWTVPTARAAKGEPDKVVVQHVLISYKGKVPGKTIGLPASSRPAAQVCLEYSLP